MAEVSVTWLGDEDPSVQQIEQYGHTFVKGVATKVPEKDKALAKFKGNQFFSTEAKPEVIESKAPPAVDPDEGTEVAAVRQELDAKGLKWHGNDKIETLRAKLAKGVE